MAARKEQKQRGRAEAMPLAIIWRNPQAFVQAQLRVREASDLYCGWAEQSRKIRAHRAHWDANRSCAPQARGLCVRLGSARPYCGSDLERGQDSRFVECWVYE